MIILMAILISVQKPWSWHINNLDNGCHIDGNIDKFKNLGGGSPKVNFDILVKIPKPSCPTARWDESKGD